jgi:hypothetical protein
MTDISTQTCLSNLRLDTLMVGELDAVAARDAERHLASCARCAARRRELADVAQDLFARRPTLGRASTGRPSPVAPSLQTGRRWGWRLGAIAGAGVATVAAMLLVVARPSDGWRAKGAGVTFEAFLLHPRGDVALVLDGDRLSPGDRLRFRVTSTRPGYVAVVSVDPAGEVSSYLPPTRMLDELPAGRSVELGGSAELDGRLGRERLLAVVCSRQLETAAVLRAVPGHLEHLEGCATAALSFEKVPRRR